MSKRKICVVTGTRAEYGLLYWLMKEIQNDPDLELQIIVTGMHLSPEFGLTYRLIEKDGFKIDYKVEMLLSSDTPVAIAKSLGLGVIGFADALDRLQPDILVVLGDRFEIFAAAQAALIARIPIAHIHGGETTEGLIDEAIRHSITKMALIHFVAAEPYRQRVIQMGEHPERVFNFGAIGLDNITKLPLLSKQQLEEALGFQFGKLNFLVTYHPVTLKKESPELAVKELITALDAFPDAKVIITKSNADTDGRIINYLFEQYAQKWPDRVFLSATLGQINYLSVLKHVDVIIGNSSSGIIEAPALRKPTVNLGDRQKGRLKAASVIDCAENAQEIIQAINKALSPDFEQTIKTMKSPYGSGNVSVRIKEQLKHISLKNILMKSFYDLSWVNKC